MKKVLQKSLQVTLSDNFNTFFKKMYFIATTLKLLPVHTCAGSG